METQGGKEFQQHQFLQHYAYVLKQQCSTKFHESMLRKIEVFLAVIS